MGYMALGLAGFVAFTGSVKFTALTGLPRVQGTSTPNSNCTPKP